MTNLEIGAFPFIIKKGKLMVMIITNCSGNAWILPKGQPELKLRNPQVALLEAFEEAGVIGNLVISKGPKDFKRKCGGILRIYPLAMHKILHKWPEKKFRKRELVSVKEALSIVTRKEHIDAIKYFSKPEHLKKFSKEKFSSL
jgi:8-oxo-dGTP pyrophosphatase MutT (NUDIX family)